MRLATRFWLYGALLPSLGTWGVALGAGSLLRAHLESQLDEALITEAATESVSLFDGDEPAHLHLPHSPIARAIRSFSPYGAIYTPEGKRTLYFPVDAVDEGQWELPPGPPAVADAEPTVVTRTLRDGSRVHQVALGVAAPDESRYTLVLSASLTPIEQTMHSFWKTALGAATLFTLVWLGLQTWQAGRLTQRLRRLRAHVGQLHEGKLDAQLPPDLEKDEVADLRDMLVDATEQLRRARTSQERLIADAAHELRTPLTFMRTRIDVTLRRPREAAELREALEETRREVERLNSLATRLLDAAVEGQSALEQMNADLRDVVQEAIDAALPAAELKGIAIALEAPAPARTLCHPPAIRQAVDNLLSNAIKYAPAGSEVRVSVVRQSDRWAISVEDQGPGIPEAQREAVFAPFHRVPGSLDGAGLGLAIVREVARRHGGQAYVGSAPTPGARVVLELAANS